MRACEGESAKLQIRRSEITMMQRRSAKVGRRKCEGAKAKKRTTFAPSHFLLLCLRSSLSCGSSFFSRRGGGVPNDYCICQGGVGRVRGIFLVILLCEINNIEISRGGGSGVQFI